MWRGRSGRTASPPCRPSAWRRRRAELDLVAAVHVVGAVAQHDRSATASARRARPAPRLRSASGRRRRRWRWEMNIGPRVEAPSAAPAGPGAGTAALCGTRGTRPVLWNQHGMRIRTFLPAARGPVAADGGADRAACRTARTSSRQQRPRIADRGRAATGGRRARRTAPPRPVRLLRIGTFDDPLLVTAPPGDRRRVFVVEQSGRIVCCSAASGSARPFLTSGPRSPRAASRACCRWRSRPTTRAAGRFYVYFTDRGGDQRVQEFRRSSRKPEPRRQVDAAPTCSSMDALPEPQWRPAAVRPRRPCSTSARATAAPGATRRTARRTSTRCSARSCASIPGAAAPSAYRSPGSNPFVGRRRAQRDLLVRAAQPVALLVRPPQRRPLHRRRGAEPARGDRLRAPRGARGRNYGWSCFEGGAASTTHAAARSDAPPILEYGRSAASARSPAAWSCAIRGLPALAGRYVYGDYCPGRIRSFRVRGGAARPATAAQPARRAAQLVRRGRAPAGLRDVADGPGLPAALAVGRRGPDRGDDRSGRPRALR